MILEIPIGVTLLFKQAYFTVMHLLWHLQSKKQRLDDKTSGGNSNWPC